MLERCCLLYLLLELEKLEMSGSCWVLCSLETLHALVLVHSMEVLFVYLVALLVDWPPHFFELEQVSLMELDFQYLVVELAD